MPKTRASIFVATIFLSFMGATTADAAETARLGFVRCGGNNFIGASGSEVQITRLTLHNFDPIQSITITGLRVYSAPGLILFDSAASGLPAFANGLLGPSDNVLAAHQSSTLFSESFLPFLAQADRPLQFLVTWSSPNLALPLGVGSTIVVRERDPVTGAQLAERTRSGAGCTEILRP